MFGVLSKVDVEGKKLTVIEEDTDKKVEIKVTDETEYVTKKGAGKLDTEALEKLEKAVKKYEEQGKKISVKVTHEKRVASKVEKGKKKAD